MHIDERFGSDGTQATAEQEFEELVAQAHARGIRVIVDTVINHAGQVFDYIYQGRIAGQHLPTHLYQVGREQFFGCLR